MERGPDSPAPMLIRRMAESEPQSSPGRSAQAAPLPFFSPLPADFPPPPIHYRNLLARLPLLLFELTADGTILFVSAAVTAATGFLPQELVGRNWWIDCCPREWARQADELRVKLTAGDVAGQEMVLIMKCGDPAPFELTSTNWYNATGRLERIIGMAVQISRRGGAGESRQPAQGEVASAPLRMKKAARKMGNEEEVGRLSAESDDPDLECLLASMADGVILYDAVGQVRRLNPAAAHLFGQAVKVLGGLPGAGVNGYSLEMPDGMLLAPKDWPPCRALAGETVQGQIIILRTPEGQKKWLAVSAAPLCRPQGPSSGALAMVTDVTGLRVRQEKQEIYLHTVSHDLRAPLTVLSGHAQLLQDLLGRRGLAEESQPSIDAILQEIERMNAMIGDLVDAARLEGGELVLELEALDLGAFTAKLLHDSELVLEVERITCDIPASLPLVCADPDRLARIFLNLLSNAQKYSPPEKPVRISARCDPDQVVVELSDCGCGIAAHDLPGIFDRFCRSRGQRKVDSVGLGLYITKMLVEDHGGRIWVESRLGEGSTFYFSLPKSE